jgi:hypothetical protein
MLAGPEMDLLDIRQQLPGFPGEQLGISRTESNNDDICMFCHCTSAFLENIKRRT